MKKGLRKLFVSIMVVTLLVGLGAPSLSSASSYEDNIVKRFDLNPNYTYDSNKTLNDLGYSDKEIQKIKEKTRSISKHIKIDKNNNFYFDSKSAIESGLDRQLVEKTKSDFQKIQQGDKENNTNSLLASCPGYNAYYAPQDLSLFDNCTTKDITYWIGFGADVTTVAGILMTATGNPTGIAVSIGAVLVNMGVKHIQHLNRGYGIAALYRDTIEIYAQ